MQNDFQPFCDDSLVPLKVHHLVCDRPDLGGLTQESEGNFGLAKILGEGCNGKFLFDFIKECNLLNKI